MLIFTQSLAHSFDASINILFTLALSSEERLKSRYRFTSDLGQTLLIHLKRGTILEDGDILQAETGECIQIIAKAEPVLTITASDRHLGNRHVPVEIQPDYLRLAPNPILQQMLELLGVEIKEEILPFHPEIGAYHQH